MPRFGKASMSRYETLHPSLQIIMDEVIKVMDFTIVTGWRGRDDQNQCFNDGLSGKLWPDSKHNRMVDRYGRPIDLQSDFQPAIGEDAVPESIAVDIAPWINGHLVWNEKQLCFLVGYTLRVAHEMEIELRWGLDWDRDYDVVETKFRDAPHLELVEW